MSGPLDKVKGAVTSAITQVKKAKLGDKAVSTAKNATKRMNAAKSGIETEAKELSSRVSSAKAEAFTKLKGLSGRINENLDDINKELVKLGLELDTAIKSTDIKPVKSAAIDPVLRGIDTALDAVDKGSKAFFSESVMKGLNKDIKKLEGLIENLSTSYKELVDKIKNTGIKGANTILAGLKTLLGKLKQGLENLKEAINTAEFDFAVMVCKELGNAIAPGEGSREGFGDALANLIKANSGEGLQSL